MRRLRARPWEDFLRFSLWLSCLALCLATPALAGPAYKPIPLAPANVLTPPADMVNDVSAFLTAVKNGDGDAVALGMAPKVLTIDGALELHLPRRKETEGPFKTVEDMLATLGYSTGGDLPEPANGGDMTKVRINAEREFIVDALSDDNQWGTDPMVKGAVCTYAYRSFDIKAVTALSKKLDVASSSLVFVHAPYALRKEPNRKAETAGTLEPDFLYALDYDTDAPGRWIAVHLPDGSTGFANFDEVNLDKPYAVGICFAKGKDGHWVMVAQTTTSL